MKRLMLKYCVMLVLSIVSIAFTSCHQEEEFDNDVYGNFDSLWTSIDQHYCFFKYKNIQWDEVGARYRAKLQPKMTQKELFAVCAEMLKELKDGHTNLISAWDVSRYWIWEQYPANYDERLIDQYYLNFDYQRTCGIKYQLLNNNFAYMYYGDFSVGIGEGNLDMIFAELASSDGLIIDVRNNGGGLLTHVEPLVGRLITERIYAGAISHKTGPGHDDFSEPYDYYLNPTPTGRIKYSKPIVVLTNRHSYSATNNFVSIMKSLPQVRIVGDATGGGCGLPFNSEMPNGWSVRYSASAITGPDGNLTEFGVEPDYKVDMTDEQRMLGKDAIMEKAFEVLGDLVTRNINLNED